MEIILFISLSLFLILVYRVIANFSGVLALDFISFWFYTYIVFAFLGSLIIITGFGDDSYFVQPLSAHARNVFFGGSLMVLYAGLGTFSIFLLVLSLFLGKHRYKEKLIEKCTSESYDKITLAMLFIILMLVFFYYLISTFPSPLYLGLINASSEDIALRRIEVTKNLSNIANTYIISIGMLMSYIVSYAYLALFSIHKKYPVRTFLSVLIASIFILSTGEKGPFLFYILGALICCSYAQGKIRRVSIKLIAITLFFLFLIYFIFVSSELSMITALIFDRIFIAQVISVYLSFDFYSNLGDIGFASLSNIFTKLYDSKSVMPASEELMSVYYPEMLKLGGWNVNGLFISEAWANFGVLGAIISPVIVGIENGILLSILMKIKKSPMQCAFYAYFTVKCVYFLTSFNAYLYHSDWIVCLLVLVLICFLNAIGKHFILKYK